MRDPVGDQLDTLRAIVERLIRDHRSVTAGLANAQTPEPGLGTSDAIREDVELTSVEAAALRRYASRATQYQRAVEQALSALSIADFVRGKVARADTSKEAAYLRCDGGAGEWDDPTCSVTGVKDVWVGGHHHWLCVRCHARYRKWKQREAVA